MKNTLNKLIVILNKSCSYFSDAYRSCGLDAKQSEYPGRLGKKYNYSNSSWKRTALQYVSEWYSPGMAKALSYEDSEWSIDKEEELGAFVFYATCRKCIREYEKILLRKRSLSVFKDDYGRECRDKWIKEVDYFSREILIPFIKKESIDSPGLRLAYSVFYEDSVENYIEEVSAELFASIIDEALEASLDLESCEDDVFPVDGHEYELYVSRIIKRHGFDASVTKGSGDHGADIIVNLGGGETVVVQCKRYNSPVGNKAVQEVYSAKDIYGADQAWVVTSSGFTSAAKVAAHKLGVLLFHHDELPGVLEILK